jgi:hypothetical protein
MKERRLMAPFFSLFCFVLKLQANHHSPCYTFIMKTIATLFMGITTFFSSLFGHTTQAPHPATTEQPIITQGVPQATSTNSTITQELETYHDNLYGFEIKYPKSLTLTGTTSETLVALGICPATGDMCEEALSISIKNNGSVESWFTSEIQKGYYGNTHSAPRFKDTTINGVPAREILDKRESSDRGGSPCYLTAIYTKGKVFEICDNLKNDITQRIIDSFTIKQETTTILGTSIPESNLVRILPKDGHQYVYGTEYTYFKDSKNVYLKFYEDEPKKIEGADPETFSLDVQLASTSSYNHYLEFSKDKNHIFFRGIQTPFTQNFILVAPGSQKDCGGGVYVSDIVKGKRTIFIPNYQNITASSTQFIKLRGADPATFKVLWTGYAKDKNHVYLRASTTGDDPNKFNLEDAYKACPIG